MSDIIEVKRALADRAQAVCEMLLPAGRKEGQEWRAGSTGGEQGKSLGVHLSGPKAGIWRDFQSGEGGDLLDLWVAVKGGTLAEALDAARAWLGMSRPKAYREPKREYQRPPKPKCKTITGGPLAYLRVDRAIPAEILKLYRVASNGDDIIFPFVLPDGVLALAKARKAEDGARPKPTTANCEPVLFGWQAIPGNAREIVIAEGEVDALSWAAYGWPGMSVPFGGGKGGKQNWIENEFERLDRFEKIYIATDMDKPGDEAAEEIASRLGRHRCYRVRMPKKDANECLMAGVSKAMMDEAIAAAVNLDPEGLRRASDFSDDIIRLFWPAHDVPPGYATPYGALAEKLLFRPGEVTLWSGAAGAGKSQLISDCVPHWIKRGSRVCLASFEMKCEQTLKRMVKQTGGVERPTAQFIQRILTWLDAGLLLYEKVGKSDFKTLLDIFEYARAKYGCDQFIIDSLMRLGIAGDDYTGQEKAMFGLVDWTIAKNVHVHLVTHARKGEAGHGVPEIEDVKGAMEIGANAFNILTVWRNRKLEEQLQAAETDEERAVLAAKAGVILNVAKQRNGDFEGKVRLWFDQDTYRYRSVRDDPLWGRRFLPDDGSSPNGLSPGGSSPGRPLSAGERDLLENPGIQL